MNNIEKKDISLDSVPKIYCALSLFFDLNININLFIEELNRIGIFDIRYSKPKSEKLINFDIAIINYEHLWTLEEALTKMFSNVDNCIVELKKLVEKYNGEIYIDIAFCQYGTYPALLFNGMNMEKIHFLNANISIDPY